MVEGSDSSGGMDITASDILGGLFTLVALFFTLLGVIFAIGAFGGGSILGGLGLLLATGIIFVAGVVSFPLTRRLLSRWGIDLSSGATGVIVGGLTASSVVVFLIGMVIFGATVEPSDSARSPDVNSGSDTGDTDASGGSDGSVSSDSGVEVRIQYSGAWQGALSVTAGGSSSTKSISGEGTESIDVADDADIVSVNAQKQDGSTARIRVQILVDGDVVAESSSTSEYGVAQTSSTVD